MSRWFAVPAIALAAGSGGAQTAEQTAALAQVSERGAMLYAYDQAAWHATDDLRAKRPDLLPTLGGYVVDGPAAEPNATFYDTAATRAVYVARFKDGRLVEGKVMPADGDAPLSPDIRRLIAARTRAAEAVGQDKNIRPCAAKPFNTVVLPPATPGAPVTVYFLTPQVSAATVPFGGHFAVTVDTAGKVDPIRRFTRACLDMPANPSGPAGAKPVALVVSEIIGPLPTEVHVFQSLTLRKPVMVVAGDPPAVWPVVGTRFRPPVPIRR